ncbi:hypothetical protein DXG03_004897 [Asterophora parasitica]|uniref:Uncharacterized protein n=1 Tax=Asterophora parasitica TaxID=117018 RepID=A0A9P7GJ89_9AGAR|nr:hypothetical protein DXG03_004897 [Asterophora parasitica]
MPANTNPSTLLAESLAALSKSAYQAFAGVENQARQDVAQATADAREARLERDTALESLHSSQLEVKGWQKEVASVKAMARLKQAETSLDQWRYTLATTPFTPNHPAVDSDESAPSTSKRRIPVSSFNQPAYKPTLQTSPPDVDSPSSINAHRVQIIRRVQAVIHVKKEESDNEESRPEDTIDVTATKKVKGSAQRRRKAVPDDDEYIPGDEGEHNPLSDAEQSDRDGGQGEVDEDEDEDDELMLGADENHRGIPVKSLKNGSHSGEISLTSSASKKRRLIGPTVRDKPPTRRKV